MVGAIIFAVVMLVVLPSAIMFGGAIWSALFGWLGSETADQPRPAPDAEGSLLPPSS